MQMKFPYPVLASTSPSLPVIPQSRLIKKNLSDLFFTSKSQTKCGSSQTWLFAIFTWKRSSALFGALLRSFANLRLRPFALICALLRPSAPFCALCALLRSFAPFCKLAFALLCAHLRSSASDCIWELQKNFFQLHPKDPSVLKRVRRPEP